MSLVEIYTDRSSEVRLYITEAQEIVETARSMHHSYPLATAALGRLLIGAGLMAQMEKSERIKLTVQIKSNGPLGGLLVTAEKGFVKGYTLYPDAETLVKPNGKLDISAGVGKGKLMVIKDFGLKEPYHTQMELCSGEIAEDLTAYFAESEQTPSAVSLGVYVDTDGSVRQAGGFIVQLLPFAAEETINQLEKNIVALPTITQLLREGKKLSDIAEMVLSGLGIQKIGEKEMTYRCDCDKARFVNAVRNLSGTELEEIKKENQPIEVECHFCDKKYTISMAELIGESTEK